ncbi:MAG: polysaccharide deacetylase [Lachnospiraceae bacterium]|nr:polysaccharide deacetylase [Lachnospiraceae bacterium]
MEKRRLTPEERELRRKKEKMKRRRRRAIYIFIFALIIAGLAFVIIARMLVAKAEKEEERSRKEAEISAEEQLIADHRALIAQAEEVALTYDYDGAIALLETAENYDEDSEIIDAIAKYTVAKTTLSPVDVTSVPHVFFHSLIVDPSRTFDTTRWSADEVAGLNAWMTTIEEFDAIIQQMYDNGYVLVRMRDLVNETVDENGQVHFTANKNLMLPAGKKAYVLSIDDWSYYHSYTGKGFGDKAVVDENGDVKIQYTDIQGNVTIGDYDVVPRLNTFMKEHPDGAYKGARGMIALTGYNGVFGYRTDEDYVKREHLQSDQKAWLDGHPTFDEAARQEEIRKATEVAEAVKASGWEFASHTWGHLSVTGKDVATLQADNERWMNNVANIVGETDTIIFAHGADIGDWHDYNAETNPVYAYYTNAGYHFYANVDASTQSWVQLRDGYFRQGRIDLDGLQMWRHISGKAKKDVLSILFDVNTVFDQRRPTPVSATGKE